MAANKRREDFGDGGSIGSGIVGDALQRVDAAEPYGPLLMAELVDGAGEPLGDLAFLSDVELVTAGLELPVGEEGAEQ